MGKKSNSSSADAYRDYKKKSEAKKAKGTTADHTFPNRAAALDNAKRLLASHQIGREIYDEIERESRKRN